MKQYKVRFYNFARHYWDEYTVNAENPVDARNVAVQRLNEFEEIVKLKKEKMLNVWENTHIETGKS